MSPFPLVTGLDLAFPVLREADIEHWRKEAQESVHDQRAYERMASLLFFQGGKIEKREDVSEQEYVAGRAYLRVWLGSFDPKHEVKELVAGYILSRIAKLTKDEIDLEKMGISKQFAPDNSEKEKP
jgi:hypothetical protein